MPELCIMTAPVSRAVTCHVGRELSLTTLDNSPSAYAHNPETLCRPREQTEMIRSSKITSAISCKS